MERYTYNKELIEKLNIKYFIEKYNLNNEKHNLAIFYALSSVYEHHCRVEQKILLTDVMKTGYLGLTKLTMDINSFNRTIISQWFDFYNLTFDEKDSQALISL